MLSARNLNIGNLRLSTIGNEDSLLISPIFKLGYRLYYVGLVKLGFQQKKTISIYIANDEFYNAYQIAVCKTSNTKYNQKYIILLLFLHHFR